MSCGISHLGEYWYDTPYWFNMVSWPDGGVFAPGPPKHLGYRPTSQKIFNGEIFQPSKPLKKGTVLEAVSRSFDLKNGNVYDPLVWNKSAEEVIRAAMELARNSPQYLLASQVTEVKPLKVTFQLALYRIDLEKRTDAELEAFYHGAAGGQGLGYWADMDKVYKDVTALLHCLPVAKYLDAADLCLDASDYKFRVTLTQPGGKPVNLSQTLYYRLLRCIPTEKWLYWPYRDKGQVAETIFQEVSQVWHTQSPRTVLDLISRYPVIRQAYIEMGTVQALSKAISSPNVRASQEQYEAMTATSPAKALGLSKPAFKMLSQLCASKRWGPCTWLIRPVQDLAKRNIQLAESFLSSVTTYLQDLPEFKEEKVEVAQVILLAVDAVLAYGGPKGKDYDVDKFLSYVFHDARIYQGITSPSEAAELLLDYYKSMTILKEYTGHGKISWFPRSLKLAHDVAAMNAGPVLQQHLREEFIKKFSEKVNDPFYKDLEYADKDFCVIAPKTPEDVVDEGARQNHCVGVYTSDIADGKTRIYFMRRTETPDEPELTLQVSRDNRLIQYRGNCNRAASKEEVAWLIKWCKKKGLIIAR